MSQDEPAPYAGRPRAENPRAMWSMILGFISLPFTCLCGFGMILGIPAVILGWQSKDEPTGRWLAIGGIVQGGISIVLGAVWFVLLGLGVVHPGGP